MSLDDDASAELERLEQIGRLRTPRVVDGKRGARVVIDGVEVLDLSSNDYLGLAADPRIATAIAAATADAGVGAGASRLIVGNHRAHADLERALGEWLSGDGPRRAARLFGSGYAANVGVVSSLIGPGDVIVSDELNHASIIDGCRLSRADVRVVPHLDLGAVEAAVVAAAGRRCLVVSETLFSMDGDIADVRALDAICRRHGAALMLDEAHALGARGPEGRGVAAEHGVVPDLLVGTGGKALGVYGAFVVTTPAIAQLLWNKARSLVFSTALPPLVSRALLRSLEIVRGSEGNDRRQILAAHARLLRQRVRDLGGASDSAIAPLVIGDDRRVMELSAELFDRRVFVQGIRYPTVREGTSRLRVSLTAACSSQDIEIAAVSINDATQHQREELSGVA